MSQPGVRQIADVRGRSADRAALVEALQAHANHLLVGSHKKVRVTKQDHLRTDALLLAALAVLVDRTP